MNILNNIEDTHYSLPSGRVRGRGHYAIIVAGGKGQRMGGEVPKQYLPVGGMPILMRTLQAGSYNTFAVPFEIDYTTLNDMGLTVKRMTASEYNESTKQLSITFVDASTIEAGKPYLVKVAASVENPTFSSVTVSALAPASASISQSGFMAA